MLTSSVLLAGFSMVNVVVLVSAGASLPPNQLVCGTSFNDILNSSKPRAVELILFIESRKTYLIFDDVIELCTTKVPP